jgi:hypothetical protein
MKQLLGLFGLLSVLATVVPAAAASPGIAYDSVTKFAMGSEAASAQPGTFDTDFQTASQPVQQQPKGGGLFGGLNAAMAQGMAMANALKSGLAERHYIAGQRQRVDNLAAQTATILDCQARTLTTLDLKNKTYKLVSLDAPQQPAASRGGAAPAPQAIATDDGSKIAMAITNVALGPRQIGPDQADGYRSDISMTITRPGSQAVTTQMTTTEYLIKPADYTLVCGGVASNVPGPGAAAMSQYAMAQRAMATDNPRFTVTNSGPALPHGRFSLFTSITMGGAPGSGSGGTPAGFASIIERGHERAIVDDDPIFTIPPDFTKTN